MLRLKKNILNCILSQRKQSLRRFSTPSLPEFADVVIIGTIYSHCKWKLRQYLSPQAGKIKWAERKIEKGKKKVFPSPVSINFVIVNDNRMAQASFLSQVHNYEIIPSWFAIIEFEQLLGEKRKIKIITKRNNTSLIIMCWLNDLSGDYQKMKLFSNKPSNSAQNLIWTRTSEIC